VTTPENTTQIFEQYRELLFSIAYRMLQSASDAEDIVQEAFLRWLQAKPAEVKSAKAYLSTVVVRLCIDQVRSSQARREVYVGPWLPEPILTGQRPELSETAVLAESLSFAFLIMLESLGPLERAVFLLHEVFDYTYAEIAEIVDKSEANCRQILHRASQHLDRRRSRFEVSREKQADITTQFMQATTSGDLQGLLKLLTDDIVYTGDSGGKVATALKPVYGPDKVARGSLGGLVRLFPPGGQIRLVEVNGQPALVGYLNNVSFGAVLLEFEGEAIRRVYAVFNPDKLRWLKQTGED
jgi:RNA polymerase sigma-70 factor, ECF subfamily